MGDWSKHELLNTGCFPGNLQSHKTGLVVGGLLVDAKMMLLYLATLLLICC
jgi:hypothetical protein